MKSSIKKYGYLWVTLLFFLISIVGHWYFAWNTYVEEQLTHRQEIKVESYINEVMRDTLENWQSEFLQLMWQVGGLAFLYYVGSPQSKEGDDRLEAKIDLLLKKIDKKSAKEDITKIEQRYPKN